ncbi:lytic transglycosylase domain-containing protein [Streptomyces sp. NPDC050560]|uniref:lytic transglycosylase domain-containing protein n=1 Tax=Streptomyces sp. NPDC050560 TaxID=3365630 RepID=UPI0037A79A88
MSEESGGEEKSTGAKTARNVAAAGLGCGCLLAPLAMIVVVVADFIIGGLGVLLFPLVILYLIFHHGHGDPPSSDQGQEVIDVANGDGKGDLDPRSVPEDLKDSIEDAGDLCDAIGPIVIASQIDAASHFRAEMIGPNGEKGISQLPPDIFKKYGKDDDDNDKVDAFDTEDSIMAQGRYMCALANEAQKLKDEGKAKGSVLDMALAGYKVGMDAVREAKGPPESNAAQNYIGAVRFAFSKYSGTVQWPDGETPDPDVTNGTDDSG